jgi:hypothetical protein
MGVIHETLPTAALYNNPLQIITAATGAAALAATAVKAIEVVHQGEMDVLMHRGGQPVERRYEREWLMRRRWYSEEELDEIGHYVTLGPGIYPVVPLLQKVVKVNVQDRTERYQGFDIESEDGQLFTTDPSFTWHVLPNGDNPYKALFNVKNDKNSRDVARDFELQQTVMGICVEGLSGVLEGRTAEALKNIDRREIDEEAKEECRDALLEYGSALRKVRIPSITRKDSEVLKQGLERSGPPNLGALAVGTFEAEESHGGVVVPFRRPSDAA